MIKRAVISYVRANFEWDHPNTQRLQEAYEMLKAHLSLSADYRVPGQGEG
ncbi:phage head-tail connector protein [Candidatus Darwinibacter acetoxidans]